MPPAGPVRPRVSRETRLLLVTALVALVALWALARIRFPDRPVSPNPLPPVLTQLIPRSPIEEIPALVAELTPRIAASVVPVGVEETRHGTGPARGTVRLGLRVAEDVAVMLLDDGTRVSGAAIVAHDRASGLALVRVRAHPVVEPATWSPRRLDLPRYLLTVDATADAVSLRLVFVASLAAAPSEVWRDAIWLLPARTDVLPGDLAFTADGVFAGLVAAFDERPVLVPAQTVLALGARLMHDPPALAGYLGLHVQPMTDAIALATGAPAGIVVTHVEPDGPAASLLEATDVIEAADDRPITTIEHWRAHVARLAPGGSVALRVRRAGSVEHVRLVARGEDEEGEALPHGLTMRSMSGIGVEIVRVDPRSAAARAGLEPGDIIRVFNGVRAPTAAQVSRAFAAAPDDRPVLAAITRGGHHQVLTMQRRR